MRQNYLKKLMTAMLLLCCTVVNAQTFEVDGIPYGILSEEEKTVSVSTGGEYTGAVTIPASVNYNGEVYSVKSIDDYAFTDCTGLTSIKISEGVTSIGESTFRGCTGLASIEIPEGVTSIGNEAFKGCTGLASINIPEGVTSIGDEAFYFCKSLASINIPEGVTSIGDFAFLECTSLTSIKIPEGVTSIGDEAFFFCNSLANIEISEGVTSIGRSAFAGCTSLTSINIPEGVTSIGESTFSDCTGLTSINIPEGVTSIGDEAFYFCTSLASIKIPEGVTSIGNDAFRDCTGLASIEIFEGVTSIGDYAFWNCSSLTSINIPEGVTSIGDFAFYNCTGLTSINIPEGVTSIGDYAFYFCTSLASIEISEGVTSIGESTFSSCTSLASINIPEGVTSIGDYAFAYCFNLTSINIPESVTSIGDEAFAYCSNLASITSLIPANKLFVPGIQAFNGVDNENCTLYVPAGAVDTYAATDGWKDFANIVETSPAGYTLKVSSAGYATMFLDYAVEIPEGIEAYTANRIEGEYLKMQLVEGVIPANTGVIIRADEGTYFFAESDATPEAVANNLLAGTVDDTYIAPAEGSIAYVLSQVGGVVGMYRAKLNSEGEFKNNANRVYMLLHTMAMGDDILDTNVPGAQLGTGYRFDFSGTTEIESIAIEQGEAVYYDLSGRRVENPTRGIYILGGKKVFVK